MIGGAEEKLTANRDVEQRIITVSEGREKDVHLISQINTLPAASWAAAASLPSPAASALPTPAAAEPSGACLIN